MASTAANTKVYGLQGGDSWKVKSGGSIIFESGGAITMAGGITGITMSGAYTTAAIQLGTNASPMTLTAHDDHIIDIYSTCASTDGSNSVRPIYMKSTMTGAGGVGGRAEFHLYTNVALGGWSNAGKFFTEYGAAGSTAGMGSALCAELQLSAGTSSGTYAPLEVEMVVPSGASLGTASSMIYLNATGAGVATFDTSGFLFEIGTGITPAAGKFISANSQTIRCKIEANTRYLVLSQSENGLGIGVSGTAVSFAQGSPLINMYATCADTSGSSIESIYCETTLTGIGGTGGRARFYTTTNVALGGWSNSLKSHFVYGANGRTTGLGSSFCAEIQMSAGTTSGTYAAIEGEIVVGSGASTGGSTSFLYVNATGADVATFDTTGYFFEIGTGITPAAGKFVSADSQTVKCKIEANTRYMVLSQAENGLGIGVSGTAVSFSQGSPLISLYSTCASTHASNSVESMYVETTMTGIGGVGGRARFYMTTNVALGDWSNGLKAEVAYGASGKTTGLGSAFCSELTLSAGTTSGTYAAIEAEINAGAACSTGTATSFLYVNGTDASGLLNDNGYLFNIGSIFTSEAAHMWYAHQAAFPANMEGSLRFLLPGGIPAYFPYLLAPV